MKRITFGVVLRVCHSLKALQILLESLSLTFSLAFEEANESFCTWFFKMWVTNTKHNERAKLNEKYFENGKHQT